MWMRGAKRDWTKRGVPFFCVARGRGILIEGPARYALGQLAQADVLVAVFVRAPNERTRFVSEREGTVWRT